MDRYTVVVTVVILLVSAFIGFNFIYQPMMGELRKLERLQKEDRNKALLLDETDALGKKITTYKGRQIPRGREEIELLDRVREIADLSQVRVTALMPRPKQGLMKKGFRKYPINVLFEGSYHNLGDFVAAVESSEIYMKIDRLSFLSDSTWEEEKPLSCDVTLSIFSVP
ncbi:MAG: type 4a pilus biogenesis protein PilO [Candidatus Omnitrophota bacterium]